MMPKMPAVSSPTADFGMLKPSHGPASHKQEQSPEKAILLVAFGTSVPAGRNVLREIAEQVQRVFPEVTIRWAFTSRTIRRTLARRGEPVDSPELALARMRDEGFTHVAVQSLQLIPGIEFHELYRNAMLFGEMAGGFERIAVAAPLLASDANMERVAAALLQLLPADRQPEDAVLWMGHGTAHPADAVYAAMNYFFQRRDANVHVGTISGYLELAKILPVLRERGSRKVYLLPLMAVAGNHARNDMAGDGPDSWVSILTREGYHCVPILQGLGEFPEVVAVWLDQLQAAFAEL